jgi:hypothetical protein
MTPSPTGAIASDWLRRSLAPSPRQVALGEDVVLVGLEGGPSMGVCVTSSDPELAPGEGIFIEELRAELGRRGIPMPPVAGVTHALPDHDAEAEPAALTEVLER